MEKTELISLYRRCFPYDSRDDFTLDAVFTDPESDIFTKTAENGRITAAAVLNKNTIYMLVVDKEYRRLGFGTELLELCEKTAAQNGYKTIKIGVGDTYLTPGVPTSIKPYDEQLMPDSLYPELDNGAAEFFQKRGYRHSWKNANCFDMRMDIADFKGTSLKFGNIHDGILYRLASSEDISKICDCTDDAEKDFTKYYRDPALYSDDYNADKRVVAALDGDSVVGVIISNRETDDFGSIGCTTVKEAYRGRKIATNLVQLAVKRFSELGVKRSFLGYTYSGLDKLYGSAGYKICVYYLMAEKDLTV